MINDLLAEAVGAIREYYLDSPCMAGVYEGPIRGELEALCALMDELRVKLVAPASGPEYLAPTEYAR
jgi:hypothetical protein